jgi:uncharacterized damage-inducible protein DinB
MRPDEVRFLFGYDEWATRRILDAWERLDASSPAASHQIGERGLTAIMVHTLGAAQRWRAYFVGQPRPPRREEAPDPESPAALRGEWEEEWRLRRTALDSLDDAAINAVPQAAEHPLRGVPMWQAMVHLFNHGTQHRSEAAVILTDAGASPGDLDVLDFAEERRGEQ